jgi:small-conductance mechanosensitive channel
LPSQILNTKNLYALIDIEPFILIGLLFLLAWFFYKLFLGASSSERHKIIRSHFQNLLRHFAGLSTIFVIFTAIKQMPAADSIQRALPYLGVATLLFAIIVFVKTCRLIILQYLFLGSMKHGVPILIVNIFSISMSVCLILWTGTSIFNIEVTPLLATSAAFSVILGLAMQDTLGNLFAGISLQVDKAFDIGDWLEVTSGSQKVVGQVKEISWRATMLVGWTEEFITLPNRFLANAQIANFSVSEQPIIRSLQFKIRPGAEPSKVKTLLLTSLEGIPQIRTWPEPCVLISEITESWISLKLIYYIENFGSQFTISDHVAERALNLLREHQIELAPPRIEVMTQSASRT